MAHFTLSKTSGSGNSTFTVTPSEPNSTTSDIIGTITIKTGGGN